MTTTVVLHGRLEGPVVRWWADTADRPGFLAQGQTMRDLEELVVRVSAANGWPAPRFLVADTAAGPLSPVPCDPAERLLLEVFGTYG